MKEKENQVVPSIGNSEDFEVDVVDCSRSIEIGQVEEAKNDDTDESISSFSGTSDTRNDEFNSGGDEEVESIVDDYAPPLFGGYQSRRKGLTEHWKKFIHPVMWRCKWIELKLNELRSQALKNDGDLAEIGKELHEMKGFEGKSRPFSCSIPRNRVMKRKKRKRYEEMSDVAPFMLQHHLLSYPEMKKIAANNGHPPLQGKILRDGDNGSAFWYGWESPDSKRFDSMEEEILTKIEALHSRVCTLRSRIDLLVSQNPGKFSYDHRLDDLMPANAASPSYGEAVPLPDMSEGMDWPFDEESPFDIDQYFATHDQPGTQEMMHDLEGFDNLLEEENPQSPNDKQAAAIVTPSNQQAWVPLLKTTSCPGKSIPKSRVRVTSMKRKRGKRKAGVNGWKSKTMTKKKK